MIRYFISQPAANDLNEIYDFIAQDDPEEAWYLMVRLQMRFERLVEHIFEHPFAGNRRRNELARGLCSFLIRRYIIFYRTCDGYGEDDYLEIVRVLHGSRDVASVFGE